MTCCDLLDSHSITADEADFPIQGETLLSIIKIKIIIHCPEMIVFET